MNRNADDWIPTRQSLLSRLRDWDDKDSWEDFFNTYWKLIYNVARKSGLNDAEAQEVVQETIIHVAKQIPGFKYNPAKGSFKGWLLKTTQWRINDQFRKRCRNATLQADSESSTTSPSQTPPFGSPAVDTESQWDELWREHLVAMAMERIKQKVDPRELQMFEMTVERDWPPLKVAQKLNVTRAHVYYARHKVSRMIRAEVERLERGGL